MNELIEKLKTLKRYDVVPSYDSCTEEQYEDGEYVRWEDIDDLIKNFK